MKGLASPVAAVLEIPLQLADGRRVQRRLDLLMDDGLIGIPGPIERAKPYRELWKDIFSAGFGKPLFRKRIDLVTDVVS